MSRLKGPIAGSHARKLLGALGEAQDGTLLRTEALRVVASDYRSSKLFDTKVLAKLEEWAMARAEGPYIILMSAGADFLGQCHADCKPAPERYVGQIAAPRTVKPFKRLDMAKLMRGGPSRPGMDDLRDCPSLMAGMRVSGK